MYLSCIFHNSFRDLSCDGAPARESPDLDSDFQLQLYLILTAALRVFSSVLLGYSHQAGRTGAVDATEHLEPGLYRQKKTSFARLRPHSSVEVSGGEVEVGAAGGNFLRK